MIIANFYIQLNHLKKIVFINFLIYTYPKKNISFYLFLHYMSWTYIIITHELKN